MAASFIISQHAAERFVERVNPRLTLAEARAAIRCYARSIEAAVTLGCHSIRLASGHRLIIQDGEVITVMPVMPKRIDSPQHSGCGYYFKALGPRKQRRRFSMEQDENGTLEG